MDLEQSTSLDLVELVMLCEALFPGLQLPDDVTAKDIFRIIHERLPGDDDRGDIIGRAVAARRGGPKNRGGASATPRTY